MFIEQLCSDCGGCGAWGPGFEKLFLAVDEGVDVIGGELDVVTVGDGVRGAGVYAIAAKDTAGIINVVDAGIAFTGGDAIGFSIFGGFDINTIRRARGSAKKTADAFLEAILVALEYVNPAVTRCDAGGYFRISLRRRFAKHCAQRDAEALIERRKCFADLADYRSHRIHTLSRLSKNPQNQPRGAEETFAIARRPRNPERTRPKSAEKKTVNGAE
jgi:hypothetical protein